MDQWPRLGKRELICLQLFMRRSHQARSVTSATIDQSQMIVTLYRDTFLIFPVKIRDIASPCDQIRFGVLGHDWSISDEPICYDRIDRSDKTPWV